MALAVCLLFDTTGDRFMRGLWARLEARGVSTLLSHTHRRHQPHLSLGVFLRWDATLVARAVAELPDGGGFPLTAQGTVVFPRGRAALAVAVGSEVARRQEAVVARVRDTGAELHHHYEPGCWVPHISLATSVSRGQLPEVANLVSDSLPITLQVALAALVDSSTGQVWPMPGIP